jgi:hypothetical protein
MTNLPRRSALAIAANFILLTACSTPSDTVTVRHFPSTAFEDGARYHLFVFDPDEPRPLAERIRIARNQIRAEPGCQWVDVPEVVIAEATARQGEPWADTLLAAPLDCAT